MKSSIKPEKLKFLTLGVGGLGLALRIVLYATGTDDKGLLARNHWACTAVWLLTAAVALLLFFQTRHIQGPEAYRDAFPVSYVSGLGAIAMGVVVLVTTISGLKNLDTNLGRVLTVVGFVAAVSLVFIGICRLMGMKPLFLCHGAVCIYFALRMVSQYQLWSSDPQLQDYVFYLMAYVCLMLTAYHHAAFDAGMGVHRWLWLLSLASVYLCCLSLKGNQDIWLLFTAGIWAFTNLTTLTVKPRRQRPALILDDAPTEEV